MAVLDPNEIMFKAFEPKVQNRFVMLIDNIPSNVRKMHLKLFDFLLI